MLPPRTKGAWAARSARPAADVMVLAHVGLDQLASPRMIWDALPFHDRPFVVRTWTYAADTVPTEPVAFEQWLGDRWDEVDQWVTEHGGTVQP